MSCRRPTVVAFLFFSDGKEWYGGKNYYRSLFTKLKRGGRIELFNFSGSSLSATDLAKASLEVVGLNAKLSVIELGQPEHSVVTTCAYCGVGCGVLATVEDVDARQVRIAGDVEHPANLGRLCSKGSSLGETVHLEGRLLHPEVHGQRTSWDDALAAVAAEIRRVQAEHGRDAVAFYVSGQLLTEDYYVANKLMKGFLGSANIDTNSRLCMSSSVAGHKRAFGSDTVPNCYEDLELADLIVLTGSNAAWCHPILFQRMLKNRAARGANLAGESGHDQAAVRRGS